MAKSVQGGAPPLFTRVLQYVAIVAPLAVPVAETITLDKWQGHTEDHRLNVQPRPQGGTFAPVYVPDVTDPAPRLSWKPVYPDRIPPRPEPNRTGTHVWPIYVNDVTVLAPARSWAPIYPDRVLPKARPVQVGQTVSNVYPVEVIPAPSLVTVIKPDRLPPKWVIPAGAVAPLYVPDVTAPVTALSWQPEYPDRIPVTKRPQGATVAPVAPIVAAPSTPDLVTVIGAERRVFRVTPAGSVAPVYVPTVTTPDPSVVCESPTRRVFRPEGGAVAPLYVPDVTVVAPRLSWLGSAPDWLQQKARQFLAAWHGPVDAPVVTNRPARIFMVPAEDRIFAVPEEERIFAVPYEPRIGNVPEEPPEA